MLRFTNARNHSWSPNRGLRVGPLLLSSPWQGRATYAYSDANPFAAPSSTGSPLAEPVSDQLGKGALHHPREGLPSLADERQSALSIDPGQPRQRLQLGFRRRQSLKVQCGAQVIDPFAKLSVGGLHWSSLRLVVTPQ